MVCFVKLVEQWYVAYDVDFEFVKVLMELESVLATSV